MIMDMHALTENNMNSEKGYVPSLCSATFSTSRAIVHQYYAKVGRCCNVSLVSFSSETAEVF
jgi:hypothetical protein